MAVGDVPRLLRFNRGASCVLRIRGFGWTKFVDKFYWVLEGKFKLLYLTIKE